MTLENGTLTLEKWGVSLPQKRIRIEPARGTPPSALCSPPLLFPFLTPFLLISSLLLYLLHPSSSPSNLLSLLTDTYTCNSQPDPLESKLRFELPATGQISERNPDRRHVSVLLPGSCVSPPARFVFLLKSDLCLPRRHLKASHQSSSARPPASICSESRVVMF